MGKIKLTNRYRIGMLEAAMKLRRQGENNLNRRIDNLCELVAEMDKKLDSISNIRDNSNGDSNPYIDQEHPRA